MTRWAMVIDLTSCIGCKACIVACSHANGIPEGLWRKLNTISEPPPPGRKRLLATRSCMHCEDPPCKAVCPTGATFQRTDGIVEIDYNKCVGCGYCILACPYDARVIYRYSHCFEADTTFNELSECKASEKQEGVCTKCNFCVTRIEKGLEKNLIPGVDDDATPLCVVTCSSGALYFGDLDDPQSNISQIMIKHQTFRLFTEVETGPSVYYIIE
ncbi:MAG: 4Fe-4S dicluster domain-containing protein [Desulfosarcina sp.]|nr:4Fe-4S dicluster domain-containing protein [Desulfosarcina sp.]